MPAAAPAVSDTIGALEDEAEPGYGPDDRYLRRLLVLLVSCSFFEGYDTSILALLLPDIQNTLRVSEAVLGITGIPIELDLLLWWVVGYTAFTALTAVWRTRPGRIPDPAATGAGAGGSAGQVALPAQRARRPTTARATVCSR